MSDDQRVETARIAFISSVMRQGEESADGKYDLDVALAEVLAALDDARDAEIKRLREALQTCREHAYEGGTAPNAAYRWCERIDEVAHAALIRQAEEPDDG
jgi:hypothetical protein